MFRTRSLFAAACLLALAASRVEAQNVAGDWYVYARTTHAGVLCVPQVGDQWWYDLSLTQSGSFVTGSAWRADTGAYFGPVSGTVGGGVFDFTIVETFPGQTTTHDFSVTLSAGDEEFGGQDDWIWTNGSLSCAGRDDVIGSKAERRFCVADAPGTCPCGNHVAGVTAGGCVNSLGDQAALSESGFPSFTLATYRLHVTGARPNQTGVFLQGGTQVSIPFRDGRLCVGQPTLRLEFVFTSASGSASMSGAYVPVGSPPFSLLSYQFWYRDPGLGSPCGTGSNLSDALEVLWMP